MEMWREYWNKEGVAETFGGDQTTTNPKYFLEELPVSNAIPESETLLDAGCGTGRYVPLIKPKTKTYVGADFSMKMLKVANQRYKHHENVFFVQCDLEHLPFREESFEVTLCIAVLRHLPIEKAVGVLREIVNSAKQLLFTATIVPEDREVPMPLVGLPNSQIIDHPFHLSTLREALGKRDISSQVIGDRQPCPGVRYLFRVR